MINIRKTPRIAYLGSHIDPNTFVSNGDLFTIS